MQGIVLETFGTGNCPSSRIRLLQILKEAIDRGVIIVNCTQCLKGAVLSDYETGKVSLGQRNPFKSQLTHCLAIIKQSKFRKGKSS